MADLPPHLQGGPFYGESSGRRFNPDTGRIERTPPPGVGPSSPRPASAPSDGGGGGGGGGSAPLPNPFPGSSGINLKSRKEIEQGYQEAIEKGQKMLEALGHESFRDLAASAMANKFTLPDNFEALLSGEGQQAITGGGAQFDPSGLQNAAATALQAPLPTPGGSGTNN